MSAGAADAAVGVRFEGDPLPGLIAGVGDELPAVAVELADAGTLEDRWREAQAPEVIFERRFADGRPFLTVEHDERAGYRIHAEEHGTHLVAPDGTRIASALPDAPAWRGLKLLAAQAIPLISTLRGREVLHAAGVVVGDRLIGIVAASGTGKSATACNVIARGGRFFADDVLALEAVDGRIRAHPGTRLLNLYARDLEAITAGTERLGERLGESDKVHFAPEGFPGALPLGGLLFLHRGPEVAATEVAPLTGVPSRLLGNAFLPYLDRADRLARQLDVMSTLAQGVPLAELAAAHGDGPAALAATVREWAEGLS